MKEHDLSIEEQKEHESEKKGYYRCLVCDWWIGDGKYWCWCDLEKTQQKKEKTECNEN